MGVNKLTLILDGKPLIRHVVDAIAASQLAAVTVVLGHEAERVRSASLGAAVHFVVNADFAGGLSTSLKAGLAALPPEMEGAMIFLGDMPDITPGLIDRMIAAFDPDAGRDIIVPKRLGLQGHPVLWGRRFFPSISREAQGDCGAKRVLEERAAFIAEVEAESDGVLLDLDTPEAFHRRARLNESGRAEGVMRAGAFAPTARQERASFLTGPKPRWRG